MGQNKNKSIIIHKIPRFPQATKPITTNKNCNNQHGRSPAVPTTATCKNDQDCQGQQQQSALHAPQIPLPPSQGKPPATKTGSRDDHQLYQQLQPARTIRIVKDNNSKEHFILHRYLCHHHKGNHLQQKQVDYQQLYQQPNNLLKVLTANVQSLSPKDL